MASRIVGVDRLGALLHTLWRAGIRGGVHQHYFEALTDIAVAFGVNIDALPDPLCRWESWTEPRRMEVIRHDEKLMADLIKPDEDTDEYASDWPFPVTKW